MSLRTILVPAVGGTAPDDLAWPEKVVADTLIYGVDLTAWLADAGQTLLGAEIYGTPDLVLGEPAYLTADGQNVGVQLEIGAGMPGQTSFVEIVCSLSQGCQLTVKVGLPILPVDTTVYQPAPASSAGALVALGII